MGLSRFWTPEKPGCGCKLVVDFLFSKQFARVRFPPPALILYGCFLFFQGGNPHLWMAKFSSLDGEILIFGWRNSHFWTELEKHRFFNGKHVQTRPDFFFRACIIYIYIYIYIYILLILNLFFFYFCID